MRVALTVSRGNSLVTAIVVPSDTAVQLSLVRGGAGRCRAVDTCLQQCLGCIGLLGICQDAKTQYLAPAAMLFSFHCLAKLPGVM
jgi:hypothetical protein